MAPRWEQQQHWPYEQPPYTHSNGDVLYSHLMRSRAHQRGGESAKGVRSKASTEKPDFAWYSAESRKQGLPPRCPIAHAELCPRYWQSLDALGRKRHGGITEISPERSALLQRKWKSFEAVIAEEEPVADEKSVDHFCPEVSYEIYGYFASFLHEFIDDIDRDAVWKMHERNGTTNQFDARWNWIAPCHYTQCREYSIHATFATGRPSKTSSRPGEVSPKRRGEVLARDSFTCVYCGRKPPEVILHADHKVSVKDGGTDDLENLVTACDKCNGGKGSSSFFDGAKPSVSPGQP